MEASSLQYLALPPSPFFGTSLHHHNKIGFKGVKKPCTKISVSKRDSSYGGNLVDENMIVLRKRIHEMKMVEKNDYEPPSNWMEWEKRYYANYDSDICEAMGFLQSKLMDTRPGLVLAMLILVILSVPTSVAVVMFHLMSLLN